MRKEHLLLAFSTVFALMLAELVLGAFFPQRTVKQYLEDRPAMFRANNIMFMDLKPGFSGYLKEEEFRTNVEINALGYRQAEFEQQKDGQQRILVVGDSFTFGYGVEESDGYVRVMERELNGGKPGSVEAINAGVPAWWTDSYYLYLKTRGIALQPDIVVLGLFMGNDIDARDARFAIWPAVDAQGLPLATTSERVRIDNGHRVRVKRRARWTVPVLRNSHLFQLLYSSVKNVGRVLSPKVQAQTLYQEKYSAETEEIIVKVEALISAMKTLSNQAGARFLVAMIPERNQVYPPAGGDEAALDYAKPQRLFAEFFSRENIEHIDLLPAMHRAAIASDEPLYYSKDSHFTATGYAIAGKEIAEFLRARDMVTDPE